MSRGKENRRSLWQAVVQAVVEAVNKLLAESGCRPSLLEPMEQRVMLSGTPVVPAAPTGLTLSNPGPGGQLVAWTETDTNISGFDIYREDGDGTDGGYTQIATIGARMPFYLDTTVQAGQQYTYMVTAFNAGGESVPSNAVLSDTEAAFTDTSVTQGAPVTQSSPNGHRGSGRNSSNADNSSSWPTSPVVCVEGEGGQTLTAVVNPTPGGNATGTVQFKINGVNAGDPITLSNGTAALAIANLTAGQTVTASYTPDDNSGAVSMLVLPGCLTLDSGASFAINNADNGPTLEVTGGTVTLNGDMGSAITNVALQVDDGASVQANASQNLADLVLAPSSQVTFAINPGDAGLGSAELTTLGGLSIDTGATLDLGNNALMINYGANPSPLTNVASWVASGQNSDANWGGTGITSSFAANTIASSGNNCYVGVGYNEASTLAGFGIGSFLGAPINTSSTAVLVVPTLYGDCLLQGTVGMLDLSVFFANFNQSTSLGWAGGDFYDQGTVGLPDYSLFLDNYGYSLTNYPAVLATSTTLNSLATEPVAGQAVTFTATMTPAVSTLTPTGTVQFQINGVNAGAPVAVSEDALSGDYTATFTTSSLSAGIPCITATYSGDDNFASSTASVGQNVAPNPGPLYSTTGQDITQMLATFTDPDTSSDPNPNGVGVDASANYKAVIDWGDGSGRDTVGIVSSNASGDGSANSNIYTASGSHAYTQPGTYVVNVAVYASTNSAVELNNSCITVIVNNPLVTIDSTTDSSVNEGTSYALPLDDLTNGTPLSSLTVDWGDGKGPQIVPLTGGRVPATWPNTYEQPFPATTITVEATSTTGVVTDYSIPITVNDVAPSDISAAITLYRGKYVLNASWSNAGQGDSHTATINWGDGSAVQTIGGSYLAEGGGSGSITNFSHTFSKTGTFYPVLTLTGQGGTVTTSDVSPFPFIHGSPAVSFNQTPVSIFATEGSVYTDYLATMTSTAGMPVAGSVTVQWGTGATHAASISTITANGSTYYAVTDTTAPNVSGSDAPVTIVYSHGSEYESITDTADITCPPTTATISGNATASVGIPYTLNLSADEPDGDTVNQWTVYWGDGTVDTLTGDAAGDATTDTHTYVNGGDYDVYALGDDPDNEAVSNDLDISVPGISITPASGLQAVVNQPASLALATFTDTATNLDLDTVNWDINWGDPTADDTGNNTSNNNSADNISIDPNTGAITLNAAHTYALASPAGQPYIATITLSDGTYTATATANISVSHMSAAANQSITATEGVELNGPLGSFSSSSASGNYQASVDWGDGNSSNVLLQPGNASGTFEVAPWHPYTYDAAGQYAATVTVTDTLNNESFSFPVTVNVADAALTAANGNNFAGQTGVVPADGQVVATFTSTNPNAPADEFTATVNWGDGTAIDDTATVVADPSGVGFDVVGTHNYSAADTYTVTTTISENGSVIATVTCTANISAGALYAPQNQTLSAQQGTSISGTVATFTDTTATAYAASIDWGDGDTSTANITADGTDGNGNPRFTVTPQTGYPYARYGSYTATVTITDVSGNTLLAIPIAVTVADGAITDATGSTITAVAGAGAQPFVVGTFADSNPQASASQFSAYINFGDGDSGILGTVIPYGSGFEVLGTENYLTAGTFQTQVQISDDGGASATINGSADILQTPTAPVVVSVLPASDSSMAVTWRDTAGDNTGYSIQRSDNGGNTWQGLGTVAASATLFIDSTISGTGPFEYEVRAIGNGVNSPWSAPISGALVPSAPSGLSADACGTSQVYLTWNNGPGYNDGVQVLESTNGGQSYSQVTMLASGSSSYMVTGLTPGSTYSFEVAAQLNTSTGAVNSYTPTIDNVPLPVSAPGILYGVQLVSGKFSSSGYLTTNSGGSINLGFGTTDPNGFYYVSASSPQDAIAQAVSATATLNNNGTSTTWTYPGSSAFSIYQATPANGVITFQWELHLTENSVYSANMDILVDPLPQDFTVTDADNTSNQVAPTNTTPVTLYVPEDASGVATFNLNSALTTLTGPSYASDITHARWEITPPGGGTVTQVGPGINGTPTSGTFSCYGSSLSVTLNPNSTNGGSFYLAFGFDKYDTPNNSGGFTPGSLTYIFRKVYIDLFKPTLTVCDTNNTANTVTDPSSTQITIPEQSNGSASITVSGAGVPTAAASTEFWEVVAGIDPANNNGTNLIASGTFSDGSFSSGTNVSLSQYVSPGDIDDKFTVACAHYSAGSGVGWGKPDEKITVDVFDPTMQVSTILNNATTGAHLSTSQMNYPGAWIPVDNNDWNYANSGNTPDDEQAGVPTGDQFLLPITLPAIPNAQASDGYTLSFNARILTSFKIWQLSGGQWTSALGTQISGATATTVYLQATGDSNVGLNGMLYDTVAVGSATNYATTSLTVEPFMFSGPMDVPGNGTYTYTTDAGLGYWVTPSYGVIAGSTQRGPLIEPGSRTSSVNIKWSNEPNVGLALYHATNSYTWGWGVNIVQFEIWGGQLDPGDAVGQMPGKPVVVSDTDSPFPPYGMGVSVWATMRGPTSGTATEMRGLNFMNVGIVQNADIVNASASFLDDTKQYLTCAGTVCVDNDEGQLTPWYYTQRPGYYAATPTITYYSELSRRLSIDDSPRSVLYPAWRKGGVPSGSLLASAANKSIFVDYVVAETTKAPGVYIAEAQASWSFDASGTFSRGPGSDDPGVWWPSNTETVGVFPRKEWSSTITLNPVINGTSANVFYSNHLGIGNWS